MLPVFASHSISFLLLPQPASQSALIHTFSNSTNRKEKTTPIKKNSVLKG